MLERLLRLGAEIKAGTPEDFARLHRGRRAKMGGGGKVLPE